MLWETEFYALSLLNGELESNRGMFIDAESLQEALKVIRGMNLDYLQLTGKFFTDSKSILDDDAFYEKLEEPKKTVKGMSYDDFNDWLEKAQTREDLEEALAKFRTEKGMSEYVRIIEAYIKNYDEKERNNENIEDTDEKEDPESPE